MLYEVLKSELNSTLNPLGWYVSDVYQYGKSMSVVLKDNTYKGLEGTRTYLVWTGDQVGEILKEINQEELKTIHTKNCLRRKVQEIKRLEQEKMLALPEVTPRDSNVGDILLSNAGGYFIIVDKSYLTKKTKKYLHVKIAYLYTTMGPDKPRLLDQETCDKKFHLISLQALNRGLYITTILRKKMGRL